MRLVRFWPILLLLAVAAAVWASGLPQQINWATLARHHAWLTDRVAAHPWAAPSLFVFAYVVVVALSLPQAVVLTVTGGLLFGTLAGGALAVIGSSLGACVLFLAVRHHLADRVAAKGGRTLERVRAELVRDGFSYLLAVRLIPVLPFWLVNLAAALSGMRLIPYAAATVIGIMPATFVFASIGDGLGQVLSSGGAPDLGVIFSPHVLGPLIGLAALSLLPVAWHRWKQRGG